MAKKKSKRDRTPNNNQDKGNWGLFLVLAVVGIFIFVYSKIFNIFAVTLYKPYYFVSSESDALEALLIIFGIFVFFSLGIYLFGNTNISKD